MGREGGAACLRRHMEVGKLIPEASRAGAGASAGRITSSQAVSSPQRRDSIRHLWLVADMGGRDAKLPFAKSEARAHYFNVLSIAWTHCGGFFLTQVDLPPGLVLTVSAVRGHILLW